MVTRRQRKVAERIHEELSERLERDVSDPRLEGVTLTAVEVTADLKHATVFYSTLAEGVEEIEAVEAALERARSFLRKGLAGSLDMRVVPDLAFRRDRSLAYGQHIEQLLGSLREHE
jgi:ribosome-binding factor A